MSQHIYTYDAAQDQLNEIGGAGHIIEDASGTAYTKRENLKFEGATVTDDPTNNATIVSVDETNFVGTWNEWSNLSLTQKAKYKTVDLTDDFNGDPIDATPTANSLHAVQSGGVYTALAAKADETEIQTLANKDTEIEGEISDIDSVISANGAKNILPNTASTQVVNGITWTVNADGTVTANGTASSASTVNICYDYQLPSGRYKLSGITGGSDSTYYLQLNKAYQGSYSNARRITTKEMEVDLTSNYDGRVSCFLAVLSGVTVNNLVFKPMLTQIDQLNSDYDHYVPYAKTNRELTDLTVETVGQLTKNATYVGTVHWGNVRKNGYIKEIGINFNLNAGTIPNLGVLFTIPEGYRPKTGFPITLYATATVKTILWVDAASGEVRAQGDFAGGQNYLTAHATFI